MSTIDPEHGSPGKLGYDFTPNASSGGGESGYVSEIALFGFFTICDRNSHSDNFAYSNFRAIDINNVAHHLHLAEIRNCCNRGYYEKIELSRELEIGYIQGATGMPVLMEYGAHSKPSVEQPSIHNTRRVIPPCQCLDIIMKKIGYDIERSQRPAPNYQTFFERLYDRFYDSRNK